MELTCISMDYCQMDFEELLLTEYQDEGMVLNYSKQLAKGLSYLHGKRGFTSQRDQNEIKSLGHDVLIHYDLNPNNVLVKTQKEGDKYRQVLKVADFGLTRPSAEEIEVGGANQYFTTSSLLNSEIIWQVHIYTVPHLG